jgi:SAM-dependent methyltransferase
MTDLARLYRFRFDEKDRARKMAIWEVLCDGFFLKLVGENQVVLDLASGFGEFSNNIRARRKIAVDINPDARHFLPEGVEFHSESATDLGGVGTDTVDVVFTSNFLEHLRTKEELDAVFTEILRVLRRAGALS